MEESSGQQDVKSEIDDNQAAKGGPDLSSLKQINCQVGAEKQPEENEESISPDEQNSLSPSRNRSTGTKVKRKSRSTRKRFNAMMNNTSLHFSDTDSEGELTMITSQMRNLSPSKRDTPNPSQAPVISVTLESPDGEVLVNDNPELLSVNENGCRRNSFIENLTDVDEIYASDPENEQKENRGSLTIQESPYQGETDMEDLEGEEDVQVTIYVEPRSDILCDFNGETITTKEGDGPFSVEIRNQMFREEALKDEASNDVPDIIVMPDTDVEDMDVSEEEGMDEACCSQKEIFEDLDVLAGCQIVMKNLNKVENALTVKEAGDEGISDCPTDVEDVE